MAVQGFSQYTFTTDSTDPGEFSPSTGTDLAAMVDDAWDSPNDSEYITSSGANNDEVRLELTNADSHPSKRILGIIVRAKVASGTASLECNMFGYINAVWQDAPVLDTTTADYFWAAPAKRVNPDVTSSIEANYFHIKVKAAVVCTIYNVSVVYYPDSVQDYIVPNADGTTTNFTPSTGTSHYALVDEWTETTTGDDGQYLSSTARYDIEELALETPAVTTAGVGDFVSVYMHFSSAATITIKVQLKEGATSITNKHTLSTYNGADAYANICLVIQNTPTSWADVFLSIEDDWTGRFDVERVAVYGPFSAGFTNYDVSITEAITVGDTQTALAAALGSLSESITVGDTQSGLAGTFGSFAEGITVGEAQTALASALGSVSESVLLTDLFSGLQLFLASISEGISVGDTQSSVASALAAFSESITVGDTQTALAGALAALTEGVLTGDTQSGLATALAILAAENVNLNEVLTSLQVFLAYMTESITVGDTVSAEAAALAAFAESLAAGDAPSATATALAALSEGITNAEVFAAVAAAYASVNEGILVGETWSYPLIGAHLVGTFSIEPLLAASPSNQPLLAATVTTEGLEGVTITINR